MQKPLGLTTQRFFVFNLQKLLTIYSQAMEKNLQKNDRRSFKMILVLLKQFRSIQLDALLLLTLLPLFFLLITGCAGFKTENQQEFNLMASTRTPLYKTGPNQTTPDTYLEQGTRLRMLRIEGDSALVETTYGLQGYISQSAVQAAAQEPSRNQY